nr:hypothetical protein [Enterovibrio nigricans]
MMNLATKQRPNILTPERVISNSLFFVPGLLLWTPNFSVAIAIFLVIYATVYCIQNRKNISLTKLDKLIFVFLSAYFLVNVPNVILDLGNFRYIDGPSKILLCIPVYLLFKQELPNISVKKHLEYGLVVGAIGA